MEVLLTISANETRTSCLGAPGAFLRYESALGYGRLMAMLNVILLSVGGAAALNYAEKKKVITKTAKQIGWGGIAVVAAYKLIQDSKKSGSETKTGPAITFDPPPQSPSGGPQSRWKPGDRCDTGVEGVFGNYDDNGDCLIFWDQDYADTVLAHALEIYDEQGDPDFCNDLYEVLYPGTHKEVSTLNPQIDQLVREALSRTYNLPMANWVPEHVEAYWDTPYAMQVSYKMARWIILKELCQYEPVT